MPWRRPTSCNFTPSSISPVYVVPGLYLFSARTHFCRQSHVTSLWQGSFAKLPRKSRTTGSRDLRSVQHRSSICGELGSDDASLPSHHSVSVADKTSFHSAHTHAHPTHSMQWLHFCKSMLLFTDFHSIVPNIIKTDNIQQQPFRPPHCLDCKFLLPNSTFNYDAKNDTVW